MAIQTQRVVSFEDESIVLSFDWEDTTGDIRTVRCVNTSPDFDIHIIVQGKGRGVAGRSWDQTYSARSATTEVDIPPGQRPRFPVREDEPGIYTIRGYYMQAETVPVG